LLFGWHFDAIQVWDLVSGKPNLVPGHPKGFSDNDLRLWRGCAVTPDGKTLVSVCNARIRKEGEEVSRIVYRVVVWDVAMRKQRFTFDLSSHGLVQLSGDASRLAAFYTDGSAPVLLYDIAARKQVGSFPLPRPRSTMRCVPVVFSPDGKLVATGGARTARWSCGTPARASRWPPWRPTCTMSMPWPSPPTAGRSLPGGTQR
jgi:WD40 repeat protein